MYKQYIYSLPEEARRKREKNDNCLVVKQKNAPLRFTGTGQAVEG